MMAALIGVQPGRLHLARNPAIARTVRGSPVSAIFRRSRAGASASCHAILARGSWDNGDAGGADALPAPARLAKPRLGDVTRQAAGEASKEKGLHGAASDLGGIRSGTIRFHPATGEVTLPRLARIPGANPYASDFAQARRDPKTPL
jgi:chemotaxis receptor (MCP) glutamine deamidase CheD